MALQPIPRLTTPIKLVLRQLVDAKGELWTTEVVRATALDRNTVDLILNRLQAANWVDSHKEDRVVAAARGTGPRRFWQLTEEGRPAAIDVLTHGRKSTLNRAAEPPASLGVEL